MTTKRQITRLLEPLLSKHPDLAIIGTKFGDQVVLKPVDHLIRGLFIQRTAHRDYPDYFWMVGYTFSPRASAHGGICGTTFSTPNIKEKYWSHPRHQDAFCEVVEAEILPMLRSIDSIGRLLSFNHPLDVRWRHWFTHPVNKLRLHAALGEFDIAAEAAQELRGGGRERMPWWSEQTYIEVMEQLWPCVEANDRLGVANLLHDWERQFVAANGLEHLYESTPFPLE